MTINLLEMQKKNNLVLANTPVMFVHAKPGVNPENNPRNDAPLVDVK